MTSLIEFLKKFIVIIDEDVSQEDALLSQVGVLKEFIEGLGVSDADWYTTNTGVVNILNFFKEKTNVDAFKDYLWIIYFNSVGTSNYHRSQMKLLWDKKNSNPKNDFEEYSRYFLDFSDSTFSYCLGLLPAMYVHKFVNKHRKKKRSNKELI
eukprot:GHVR01150086.1.p1 GENE.GHVR01150086.1~~GHVR01150086.1.p1  ORF type:complete len:152 (+),score=23.70 GHVR01150086.1:211-666(+)